MQSLHPAQLVVIWAIPVLFAITVHEVAHGWVANRLGDPTARMLGRLTLNPIKHIDPIGTIAVPALLYIVGGFMFGWAKPVPVSPQNLRKHRYGMALVAAAGPISNILQALVWALVMRVVFDARDTLGWVADPLYLMGFAGVTINLSLGVLNLLPVPPLDGGRIVDALLPGPLSAQWSRLEPYGFLIVVALIATKLLSLIMSPPFFALRHAIGWIVGVEDLQ
jgi:Zn-dependent protease